MALTPENNVAFMREVDEELRRDKTEDFVRRHGKHVVIAIVLLLVAAAAILYWRHREREAAGVESEQLTQAIADAAATGPAATKGEAALATLSASSRDGYAAAARLTLADLKLQKGDARGAAAAYAAISADTGLARPFRDLATVRGTAAEFDTLPPGTVIARLQSLAVAGQPFFGSAGEMTAVALLQSGKRAEAGALFGRLARDPAVPETLRSRAVQMAGILGVDAVPQNAARAGGTTK